jgi:hypothetical protein
LHLVVNAKTRTPTITRIVPGRQHDLNLMTTGSGCHEALLVFDLAYFLHLLLAPASQRHTRQSKDTPFTTLRRQVPKPA